MRTKQKIGLVRCNSTFDNNNEESTIFVYPQKYDPILIKGHSFANCLSFLQRKTDRKPRASASGSAFSGYRKLLRMNDGQINHT